MTPNYPTRYRRQAVELIASGCGSDRGEKVTPAAVHMNKKNDQDT